MKVKKSRIILFSLFLTSLLFSGQKIKEKDLSQKYRDFLKLTHYIIRSQEKDVFMQLITDREKDIFIKAFWKQRDPTLGTPKNEYKDELIKRFLYANKHFRRGSPREGWMTDKGRFYIILGPPVSIERFYGTLGIYPCEVWYYYGEKEKALPPHFALVFYQRGGTGEFKLYDPFTDGPASLMIHSKGFAIEDYEAMYERIQELAPTLALVSISMIPGDIPFNYLPSPRNAMIMAEIIESPKKDVNPSYATHFLSYRGVVSTEYMMNFVESETSIALITDPIMGINFLHFSVVPKSLSIDYYEPKGQYYCNFTLDVSLRIKDDIIFHYSKDFPLYFPPKDLERIRANGISIEDSFPVVEGEYKLIILLQNSVGKEFCIFEKEISIPEDPETPKIVGPFLGYRFQDYQSSVHIPFKIINKKLVVDPKNTFSASDDVSFYFNLVNVTESLWNEGRVMVSIRGLREESPVRKSFSWRLNGYLYNKILNIPHSIPAKELSPDYYEIKVTLVDENGESIDEEKANFIISPAEAVSHPIARAKTFPLSKNFLFFYMLAGQYREVKAYGKAELSFEKAYGLNPDYKKGLIEYANFLIRIKKFDKSLELIENIKENESLKFDYYLIKGKAHMGMGKYEEAIDNLVEGNKIYNSDIGLLNSLGFCYYKTKQKEKALAVLKASQNLNSGQKEIKKLIEEIKKSRD